VTIEAMAAGRPVICLDLGGPGVRITEATGIKIPALNPEQATADLAAGLELLATDPTRLAQFALASRLRVDQEFNWDRRGEQLARLYERLLKSPNEMPQIERGEAVLAVRQRS